MREALTKKFNSCKGVNSQDHKRKSRIQDATQIPILHTRCKPHTKSCILDADSIPKPASGIPRFSISTIFSGARKEPDAIPPNANEIIVKATRE